jgi:hypothetical protein
LYAEKKCRKLAMGEVNFSPELNKARQRKLLWKKIVWHKRGGESAPRTSSARPDNVASNAHSAAHWNRHFGTERQQSTNTRN